MIGRARVTPAHATTRLARAERHLALAILRHAQISVTMDIYAKASSKATREALKRLGQSLDDQPESE